MAEVRVSFTIVPDEPDPDDSTGMSIEEYDRLCQALMEQGATDIHVEQLDG